VCPQTVSRTRHAFSFERRRVTKLVHALDRQHGKLNLRSEHGIIPVLCPPLSLSYPDACSVTTCVSHAFSFGDFCYWFSNKVASCGDRMMLGKQHAEPRKRPSSSSCYPRIFIYLHLWCAACYRDVRRLCIRMPVVPSYRRDKEESCAVHYGDVATF
jgi:hypothetical protein